MLEQSVEHRPFSQEARSSCETGKIAQQDLFETLNAIETRWSALPFEQACALHRCTRTGLWTAQYFQGHDAHSVIIDTKAIIRHVASDASDAVILCHSHPCSAPHPSSADIRTTKSLAMICRALQVELVDHVIFGDGAPFSFRSNNYL